MEKKIVYPEQNRKYEHKSQNKLSHCRQKKQHMKTLLMAYIQKLGYQWVDNGSQKGITYFTR